MAISAVAQKGTVEVDVLLRRELHVKTRTELNQGRDGPLDLAAALRRLEHAGDDLEHRGLARAVRADQAKGLSPLDLEADVVKCTELLEAKFVAGEGDEVLLEGVELLRGYVEDHRDVIDVDDGGGIRTRNAPSLEAKVPCCVRVR